MQEPLDRLFQAIEGSDTLLILPHSNPDPDAIASALALRYLLAKRVGVQSHILYEGIIGRAENKALVAYLGHPLQPLSLESLSTSLPVALIDTQPGTGNNALPQGHAVTIVIDHHPMIVDHAQHTRSPVTFADVRSGVGATSTILTAYLQKAGLDPPPPLATALFYGIETDTMGLGRGAGPLDVQAYFYLQPRIDVEALAKIQHAQVPAAYFQDLVAALRAVQIYDCVVACYIGPTNYPDAVAEMADILLRLEGACWVICMGSYQDKLFLSVRTQHSSGAGHLAQAMVLGHGTAGGHGTLAGGQVPLDAGAPEELAQRFTKRALQHLGISPDTVGRPLISRQESKHG
jgi:nanoRNase/pAp phosphatase (c-di-AMP/oligoRNAs hydrolase)